MTDMKHMVFCREAILDASGLMTLTGFTGGSAVALPSPGDLDLLTVVVGFDDLPRYDGVFSVSYGVVGDAENPGVTIMDHKDLRISSPGGAHTIVHRIHGFHIPRFGRYWFRIEIPTVGIWSGTLDIQQRVDVSGVPSESRSTTVN